MKALKILLVALLIGYGGQVRAQFVISEVVKLVVKKVIKAIDLKVQRLQNQTIWLQNAQKTLENELSRFRLTEISSWSDQQRKLYDGYYRELMQVKSAIAYYQRIKTLTLKQVGMVREYQRAWALFRADRHFKPEELEEMQRVYLGMLEASAKNLDQILLVINPGKTQMTDQQRLEMINKAGDLLEENFSDLKQYNHQNMILSLHRSKDLNEIETIKHYYGIH